MLTPAEKLDSALKDLEEQWCLVTYLWGELDMEYVMSQLISLDRRWVLDLLVARMSRMDDLFDKVAYIVSEIEDEELVALDGPVN